MSNAEDVPFEIRRADFFALAWAALGMLDFGIAAALFDVLYVAVGLLFFGMAGYQHFRPDSMDNGTDPAPRAWFEVAGLMIALSVLAIVIGVLLFPLL